LILIDFCDKEVLEYNGIFTGRHTGRLPVEVDRNFPEGNSQVVKSGFRCSFKSAAKWTPAVKHTDKTQGYHFCEIWSDRLINDLFDRAQPEHQGQSEYRFVGQLRSGLTQFL